MTTHSTSQAPLAQHGGYSLVRVEQLSQAPPANDRSVRYTGSDGLDYRSQAVFDNSYRIRLQPLGGAFSRAATHRGVHWFNGVQPGGDATLPDFQTWARSLLDRGLVHSEDADAWRATFIDVEGGGRGQYILSAADSTWRTLVVTVPCSTVADSDSDESEPRQLQHASFGTHVVQHSFETDFAQEWAQKLKSPRAWLPLLIADV